MKRIFSLMLLLLMMTPATAIVSGCNGEAQKENSYEQISQITAKKYMDTDPEAVILDTRTAEEYAEGYIPGAILIPHDEISEKAEQMLPDKNKLILVYCRSGRRSKIAAQTLVDLGYTNVKEFGGINDWEYEIVK